MMEKREKNFKEKEEPALKDFKEINDLVTSEYYDWRLKTLAEKIKVENFRPSLRIYNF